MPARRRSVAETVEPRDSEGGVSGQCFFVQASPSSAVMLSVGDRSALTQVLTEKWEEYRGLSKTEAGVCGTSS